MSTLSLSTQLITDQQPTVPSPHSEHLLAEAAPVQGLELGSREEDQWRTLFSSGDVRPSSGGAGKGLEATEGKLSIS